MRVRQRMPRALSRFESDLRTERRHIPVDGPRQVQRMIIDFGSLGLPKDVRLALADAFWNHVGPRSSRSVGHNWRFLRVFARFVAETDTVQQLADFDRTLLVRYVEWLGQQRTAAREPWSKTTRSAAYTALRKLLQWLERCRPGLVEPIDYPYNPFPWRRRDTRHRPRLSPQELRAILRACENDIVQSRALRLTAASEVTCARASDAGPAASRGALREYIDAQCGGIIPPYKVLMSLGYSALQRAIAAQGGARRVEPCLYPTSDAILPYYIAILIHTAGNPEAIAALRGDCLRPIPLLDDREMLVWDKPRASTLQRRAFRRDAPLDPPALVRDILEWTSSLRRQVAAPLRNRLFLYKGPHGVTALAGSNLVYLRRRFVMRHQLSDFELASIRSSVLTTFYRASGDLRQVRAIANHAQLSTTVAYVEGPAVEAQNRIRVATLQNIFLEHLRDPSAATSDRGASRAAPVSTSGVTVPTGEAVSMFGFSCKDPLAGVAPGTRAGELCTNFLGCLTCPNAILTHDARTLARLLQARDHLRAASSDVHPARWGAIYAPELRILEEDILTRFSAQEIGDAQRLGAALAPLPPLR
jgi:hypothetical protein